MIGIKWKVYKGNIETSGGHKLSMTCALFMGFTQDILVGARSEVRTLALSRTKLGKCFCSYPATGIFFKAPWPVGSQSESQSFQSKVLVIILFIESK